MQMQLGQLACGEHRGLGHMHELLANWIPSEDSPDRRGWELLTQIRCPFRTWSPRDTAPRGETRVSGMRIPSQRLAEGTPDGLIRIGNVHRETDDERCICLFQKFRSGEELVRVVPGMAAGWPQCDDDDGMPGKTARTASRWSSRGRSSSRWRSAPTGWSGCLGNAGCHQDLGRGQRPVIRGHHASRRCVGRHGARTTNCSSPQISTGA